MCNCRICTYYRLFKKHIKNVPEESKEFFEGLYERYSMVDDERDYLNMKLDALMKKQNTSTIKL